MNQQKLEGRVGLFRYHDCAPLSVFLLVCFAGDQEDFNVISCPDHVTEVNVNEIVPLEAGVICQCYHEDEGEVLWCMVHIWCCELLV